MIGVAIHTIDEKIINLDFRNADNMEKLCASLGNEGFMCAPDGIKKVFYPPTSILKIVEQ